MCISTAGRTGRSAVWGSRWCRWVRKSCFSSLLDCLTLSRSLCLCFFSCEVGGAILTLTSKAQNLGWSAWNCCHIQLTRLKDVFHSKHYFHLEKSPSISGFPPLPSQDFLLKFFMCKSCISPSCFCVKLKIVCNHELSFKYLVSALSV